MSTPPNRQLRVLSVIIILDLLSATMTVPLFPLPNVFLFPGQVLPLHIFEPRYRKMIADVLDGPGRIAVALRALGIAL